MTTMEVAQIKANPVLGSLLDFRKDRLAFLRRLPEQYGGLAMTRVGFVPLFCVTDRDVAHEALVERADAFIKGYGLSVFAKPLLGEGLLTAEGAMHKRQRRMIAPAFTHKRIAEFADTIAAAAAKHADALVDGSRIDASEHNMKLTLDIVGRTLFSADLSGDAREIGDALTIAMENMIKSVMAVVPVPPTWPTPRNLRGLAAVKRLDEIVYRLIRERRASGIKDTGDLLSMLLMAQDEDDGGVMNDKQVRDEAMTIVLAGHETTANALAWATMLLSQHPEARDRLENEVDVLGGRVPTLADLPKLSWSLAVVKEAMRLYPPAYVITRLATRDVSIGGVDLRKGTVVLVNILGMHRRPEYFERPNVFDPTRFLPDNEKLIPRGAFMPFGGGPRICIGNHFALMEAQICLAVLAQRARLNLVHPREEIVGEPLVTLRPKHGVMVNVERRRPVPN
jgi:cytochrome P450